jgi:hypothetical protein
VAGSEPSTFARRMLSFCFAVLVSVILLTLALQLLSQIWGWLAFIAVLVSAVWLAVKVRQWRAQKW